jgi:hypothetical protein
MRDISIACSSEIVAGSSTGTEESLSATAILEKIKRASRLTVKIFRFLFKHLTSFHQEMACNNLMEEIFSRKKIRQRHLSCLKLS